MNDNIINNLSIKLNISLNSIENTLQMLKDGNTIPFIARYRKDKTGNLTEEQIKTIGEVYEYQVNLLKRKEDVIRLIDEKGLLTNELKLQIENCSKLVEVEDLYRPYKEKKKTKATEAIKNGLEPFAKIIMSCPLSGDIKTIASKFLNDNVKDINDAINGAKYIIAEWISDNAYYRKYIRNNMYNYGIIETKLKKNAKDEAKLYEMYYNYSEEVNKIKPHRVLAINRAEKEDVISVKININEEKIIQFLQDKSIKNKDSFCSSYIKEAIEDSYKRLIYLSTERQIRSDLTQKAHEVAIDNFSKNVEALLLTAPIKEKVVLAFDPGYVNGCKLAVVDKTGKYLDSCVIKPFLNNISDDKVLICKQKVVSLIKKYNVDIIAIGNGTASRESEKFCADMIKEYNLSCKYVIVSEAGASVYSASKLAIEEFGNLEVEKRSAISIARRLQDPLSELVKVPPEAIGVGLYQHDIQGKRLSESLDFVVSKAVNSVGVNVNTASASLLKYVSGLKKNNIEKIIDYRQSHGKILTREEIKKKKILSDKVYEQAIGFLRITEGDNILDETSIHPESYDIALKLLSKLGFKLEDIGNEKLISYLNDIDINSYLDILNTDIYTLKDVIDSLKKPNRDPRDEMIKPILKSDVLTVNDLKVGMKLEGTVRNVIDFGAFIDIGLHNDGLVHISKISKDYIKHPSEVLSVGDIVSCYVIDINKDKEKVSLSLIES